MATDGMQLPLLVKLQDQAVFANYYSGPNTEIINQLRKQPGQQGGVIWVWGEAALGKSHLLQAVCSANENSAYLPGSDIRHLGPDMLQGFDRYTLVCLDDIDDLIGHMNWEHGLFAFFNQLVTERQSTLIVSSQKAPKSLQFDLPDLKSRLLSGPVYRLAALDDTDRLAAIQLRAKRRGLELPAQTGQFLLKHFKRDMRSLCDSLDKLDTASLVHQRRLTIPLIKATLNPVKDETVS